MLADTSKLNLSFVTASSFEISIIKLIILLVTSLENVFEIILKYQGLFHNH